MRISRLFVISFSLIFIFSCGGGGEGEAPQLPSEPIITPPVDPDTNPNTDPDDNPNTDPETESAVEKAIRTGNVLPITNSELLIDALQNEIQINKTIYQDDFVQLFSLNSASALTSIDWDPTHDAALLGNTYGINEALLTSNAVYKEGRTVQQKNLAILGKYSDPQNGRYMVFGSSPFRNLYKGGVVNEQMQQLMRNSLAWLINDKNLENDNINVVLSHLNDGYYFPDERATRSWLDAQYAERVTYNEADQCDALQLSGCINEATDLIIISQDSSGTDNQAVIDAIENAQNAGIPVLYTHLDGGMTELGNALFKQFNVSYLGDNYWQNVGLKEFDINTLAGKLPADINAINTLLSHLKNKDYQYDFNLCVDKVCPFDDNLQSEFKEGASASRDISNALDSSKTRIWDTPSSEFRMQKLLVLLADHLRQGVTYPMDVNSTDSMTFLSSLFSDHVLYNYRDIAPAQPDLGNFGRSDFSHITPQNKTINLTSKKNFRSAGIYALPGQTVTITRLDNNAVNTQISINTQRAGATHEWDKNGYTRPKYLKSTQFKIAPNETLKLTSSYGGPIQISFDSNDIDVRFEFKNIGTHPYWNGNEDNQAFAEALAKGDYDWAELSTAGFEVHSTLDKMRQSMENENWPTASELAEATARYTSNFPHVLAGFQGPGIDIVAEIHDFAAARNMSIDNIDMVKHMNADQATCGYGCSGNPYDAYWSFSPTGHGDLHELGHGLEKGRFRFEGFEGHASTNPYSYYSKSRFFDDTGEPANCQKLPFDTLFEALQQSKREANAFIYMQEQALSSWSQGMVIYVQLMMQAEFLGKLESGWHLYARLHIVEREFNRAKKNETQWLLQRNDLGFSQYSLDEAKALTNNDWIAIALSSMAELNYIDYLTMWGIDIDEKAKQQVASFNYQKVPETFFMANGNDYCEGFNKAQLTVDGLQVWPE